jgi:hypothetical protein
MALQSRCVRGFTNVCSRLRLPGGMEKTWTINEIRDGEAVEIAAGASHADALDAIRAAMYGESDAFRAPATDVHELPLVA